jgi:AraC-like DNA-binding protein
VLYREYPAPPDLAPYVRAFWTLAGTLPPGSVERLLPDGRQELIVHLGDPFEQCGPSGTFAPQHRALFTGQTDAPLLLRPAGSVAMFGVCFHPGGAWPFLGWSQEHSAGRIFPMEEAWPMHDAWDKTFADRIRECPDDRSRCLQAAALLRAHLRPNTFHPGISAAIATMQREPWQRIEALAQHACLSRRHFERLFLQRVGLRPKTLAGIFRFQHVLRARESQPAWTWARVAQEAGYFDQAHLIADFRRFSGSTPAWHDSDWTAMERVFVRP